MSFARLPFLAKGNFVKAPILFYFILSSAEMENGCEVEITFSTVQRSIWYIVMIHFDVIR
jgi:hypothetical protein